MGRKFENILGTVGNTPIVRIGKLAPAEANLFVKIEAFNPLVKMLHLIFSDAL